eukprot:CAMPEP_0182889294 /NCGR_PEP_ID=MMETSP0034_2-20130328/21957_1 /TAXON_ID=156128 /ORGANISM="Nephroselmis pyriformis, Strain CCMP717" /LENGTH=441 /DNA_ID=CAMNT_0025022785 /DNA_START=124 /DNA_END=1446 /DNA_ORIENTATION=+
MATPFFSTPPTSSPSGVRRAQGLGGVMRIAPGLGRSPPGAWGSRCPRHRMRLGVPTASSDKFPHTKTHRKPPRHHQPRNQPTPAEVADATAQAFQARSGLQAPGAYSASALSDSITLANRMAGSLGAGSGRSFSDPTYSDVRAPPRLLEVVQVGVERGVFAIGAGARGLRDRINGNPITFMLILTLALIAQLQIRILRNAAVEETRRRRGVSMLLAREAERAKRRLPITWINVALQKMWLIKGFRLELAERITDALRSAIKKAVKPGPLGVVRSVDLGFPNYKEGRAVSLDSVPAFFSDVRILSSRNQVEVQYQTKLRYSPDTASLRLVLNAGPGGLVKVPVVVSDIDVAGELWAKLLLQPSEPFIGSVSVAFTRPPKIRFRARPAGPIGALYWPYVYLFVRKLLSENLAKSYIFPSAAVFDVNEATKAASGLLSPRDLEK